MALSFSCQLEWRKWWKRVRGGRYIYIYISIYIWFGLNLRPTSRNPIDFRRRRRRRRQIIKEERGGSSSNECPSYIYIHTHSTIDWGKRSNKIKRGGKKKTNTQNEREKVTRFRSTSFVFLFLLSYCYTAGCIIDQQAPTLLFSLTPPPAFPPFLLSNNVTF